MAASEEEAALLARAESETCFDPPGDGNRDGVGVGVVAVVVVYRPSLGILRQLLESLRPQVSALWIVNNGEAESLQALDCTALAVEVIHPGRNLGIGAAVELAVRRALREDFEYLLTLDQDSTPDQDMVPRLRRALEGLVSHDIKVGAVGPCQIDRRTGHAESFMAPIKGWPPFRKKVDPPPHGAIEVDHLITSGLLVPLRIYEEFGLPRADLFIDYVDIEWSLRIRSQGYGMFAVHGASLFHSIGDRVICYLGKQIPVHSPIRHYYVMRNAIVLQRSPYVPFAWKVSDAYYLLKRLIFYSLFLPQRSRRVRLMLLGLLDGFRGRLGALSEEDSPLLRRPR